MKHLPKIVMITAVLLPVALFFFPLWKITLSAPQYPDGISMYIWINKITGDTDYTLQNINILNHYVGMKYIVPDSIPELKYFPYIIIGIVFFGLIIAFTNNKKFYLAWTVILLILGILGIYDFYLWEYDYGHNLSPKAPIKVPGMAYQPPVFGTKMLLNFKADSYPDIGGILLGLSILLGFLSFWLKKKKEQQTYTKKIFAMLLLIFASSCSVKPQEINYGLDNCEFCKMTIIDQRYGAEIVTTKGKVYKFDAIECLIDYDRSVDHDNHLVLVSDYFDPGTFLEAKEAYYLQSKNLPSPMGMYLNALKNQAKAEELQKQQSGIVMNWTQLQERFDEFKADNQSKMYETHSNE